MLPILHLSCVIPAKVIAALRPVKSKLIQACNIPMVSWVQDHFLYTLTGYCSPPPGVFIDILVKNRTVLHQGHSFRIGSSSRITILAGVRLRAPLGANIALSNPENL